MSVRVRIAPSPTGFLHFGTARTALFNWLFARKNGGTFIVRIEDTDMARNKQEYDEDIFEQLRWLKLEPDETYRQSEHRQAHADALRALIDTGRAYESEEPAKDDPSKTVRVVRLRNPGKTITFTDTVHGDITFDTSELKDFVVARSVTEPLYHFAVVVDDHDAGITHVIRGEDHISNTPRQILIQEALGYDRPVYAHIPLILAPDRSKMSKRKHDTSVRTYREKGYLPEALINYLALLGWNPGTEQELFSRDELVRAFSLEGIQKSGAVFDDEKLRWFNRQYLVTEDEETFAATVTHIMKIGLEKRGVAWDEKRAKQLMPLVRERISVYDDLRSLIADGEFDYFFSRPTYDPHRIPDKKSTPEDAAAYLAHAAEILSSRKNVADVKEVLWQYATEKGRGAVLWPLRYSLSGKDKSPDPFVLIEILGADESLSRIAAAREALKEV
ncbi:MAG TPA: glutamate--tRNA ligase [Candidatus Paceibacterota bacterium]|nr:glutamate--tRNA ligase [Candidatus Paceibacterota bacterium]